MVNGKLVTALDWPRKKGEESGSYSYRDGDTWYVVRHGPGFSNTFKVTQHDDVGLRWLQGHELKEESGAKD